MIVIADDITGAAEIAGIASTRGADVRLVCGSSVGCYSVATDGTTVIATDTRSMSEVEAVAETRRIASAINHQPSAIFKKTDSALRGHVVAELQALMEATGALRCVYLPATPRRVVPFAMEYIILIMYPFMRQTSPLTQSSLPRPLYLGNVSLMLRQKVSSCLMQRVRMISVRSFCNTTMARPSSQGQLICLVG